MPCRKRWSRRCGGGRTIHRATAGVAGHRALASLPRRDPIRGRASTARGTGGSGTRAGSVSTDDDTLQLYFLCAHPALTPASAVALTLRAVGGLTTRQIAGRTWCRRRRWRSGSAAPSAPSPACGSTQPGDVATVLRVLYLIFNEGYSGDVDLAAEAIRLTRQLAGSIDDPEVAGLLALMLLHHARRAARTAADGRLVPLAEQDRSRWDTDVDRRGRRRSCRRRWRATGSGSSRPRPRSRRCMRTRGARRRPTGCRSSSGTTSSPG